MTPRIVVIGGGIAGLAAAHRLLVCAEKGGVRPGVTLLEATPRLGGAIRTEHVQGFLLEGGPDSFLTEKPWALELARALGLERHLVGTNDAFRRTYVARGGKLHPLPDGFLLLAPTKFWPFATSGLFSWWGKLRMAAEVLLPRGGSGADESLASFVERRFGREAVERIAQPLVGGIYLADARRLSLRATMPRFLAMEEQQRSVILAMRAQARAGRTTGSGARWSLFASFDQGLQLFVDTLAQRLSKAEVRCSTTVARIERQRELWRVLTRDGEVLEADAVILAVPAPRAAALLDTAAPALAQRLSRIETIPSLTVNLAYPAGALQTAVSGFGVVIPRTERLHTWACTLSHLKYPYRAPDGTILIRAFLGGSEERPLMDWEDEQLVRCVRQELEPLLGIDAPPLLARIHRYPETMPLYEVGHLEKVRAIEELIAREPTLALAGNSYRGVGLPDCIHSGHQAADRVWHALSARARRDDFVVAGR
ncbi:MAG: protoporphyrinogen oxidase [Candidatus Binatia bacterium]|nr:protoporphyrinogen oxidase [Candidatus Binatia bacterium]